jgi:hypothetical protein
MPGAHSSRRVTLPAFRLMSLHVGPTIGLVTAPAGSVRLGPVGADPRGAGEPFPEWAVHRARPGRGTTVTLVLYNEMLDPLITGDLNR